jgi:hypothetical protein
VTIWGTDQLAADERTFEHAFTDRRSDALTNELQADERVQQLVHELMRARLNELFGPGGSFRVTLGRATADDALFVSTVADTIAWDVAAALDEHDRATPRRASDELPAEEHEQFWKHVEDELLKRRKAA